MSKKKSRFIDNPDAAIASFLCFKAAGSAVSPLILRNYFDLSLSHANQLYSIGRMKGFWHGNSRLSSISTEEEAAELKLEMQASDRATANRISREFKSRFK